MRFAFFLFSFLIFLSPVNGQVQVKIDSLKKITNSIPGLNGTENDTILLKTYLSLGNLYKDTKPDSAMWCFSMASDTGLLPETIIKFPKKSYYNASGTLNCGIIARNQGNYSLAAFYYKKSLRVFEILEDKTGINRTLNNLGLVEWNLGNYSDAVTYFKRSLKAFEEMGNKKGVSICLHNLALVESDRGNYFEAISYFKIALKIFEEMEDARNISYCLQNMGVIAENQGNYEDAVNYYLKSMKISEELNDKSQVSYCLTNLGIVARKKGNYPEAISYNEQAIKIFEDLGDKSSISKCLNNLGIISKSQGNYSEAESYYQKSLKIIEEIGDKDGIATCLTNLGIVSYSKGDVLKAISYYEKSLKIKEQIGNKGGVSITLLNLSIVARELNNYDESTDYLNRSLKICEELGDSVGISKCLHNFGLLAWDKKNYPEAVSFLKRSLEIEEKLGNKADLASNYPILAKAYHKTGSPEKAFSLIMKSQNLTLELLEDNFEIMSEEDKEQYLSVVQGIFNDIRKFGFLSKGFNEGVSDMQKDSLIELCYDNELLLKGLLLNSTVSVLEAAKRGETKEITDAYLLLKQYRDQISSLHGTEKANHDSLISDLEKKANEQERRLVRVSSEFAGIHNLFGYKWKDVQKGLKVGEAAIEFINFSSGENSDTTIYAALVITPDCEIPFSVELFKDIDLKILLDRSAGTGFKSVSYLYGNNSNALYDLIWKPLEPSLSGIKTVYFAPAGVLNKISFAALTKGQGNMLCDLYNLHQVTTTGKLISKDDAKELKINAVVFGGIDYNPDNVKTEAWKYLPGTMNEKTSIEKQLKKNKVPCISYSGKEAKEENFKMLFDSTKAPSVLHISTHGFFYPEPEIAKKVAVDEVENGKQIFRGSGGFGNWMFVNNKNPMMRSGLVFAGANRVWGEDWGKSDNEGVLTAYEVSNMNMRNTELVVLSACETGLGDIKGSEGVYGLQRAFKMAGVKYIIMSLWQVPDKETVEFMELFYKKLLKEKDVRQAFNKTQKEMRKKYDPYYWGAFVLIE